MNPSSLRFRFSLRMLPAVIAAAALVAWTVHLQAGEWPVCLSRLEPLPSAKAFATVEDLMPTVLALTGTDAPESHVMDGINILPALPKADTPTGRHHFLMHFPHRHCSSNFTAYREEGWKIIWHYDSGTLELFDLTSDPTESSDLSKTRPERLRAMQTAMQKRLDDAEALYMEE